MVCKKKKLKDGKKLNNKLYLLACYCINSSIFLFYCEKLLFVLIDDTELFNLEWDEILSPPREKKKVKKEKTCLSAKVKQKIFFLKI